MRVWGVYRKKKEDKFNIFIIYVIYFLDVYDLLLGL